MAVNFALFLSPEGIALAHRQSAGHWAFIGETRIDVDDLDAALARLKEEAVKREGADFETLLVLPDDQILYTSFMAQTSDRGLTVARIEDGLDGLTPYPVAELIYDFRAVEDDRVKVAVAAGETLEEARAFSDSYGFKAAGFAAMPPLERFPGLPVFARDGDAELDLFGDGLQFGPDTWGQPAPEPEPEPEPVMEQVDPEPAAEPDPEPAPATDPGPQTPPAAADALDKTAEASDDADGGSDVPPVAMEDLSLSTAIVPLEDDGDDATPDTTAAPAPADPGPEPTNKATGPVEAAPEAPKPPRKKPAKPLKADKPGASPAGRKARFTPTPTAAAQETDPAEDDTAEDDVPPMPSVGFSARRGKAPAPSPSTGRIVGARNSRLGFGADAPEKAKPVLHPDADIGTAATPPGRPSLTGQLARVRDAAKSRGRTDTGGQAPAPSPAAPRPPAAPAKTPDAAPLAASPAPRTAFDVEPEAPKGPSAFDKLSGAATGLLAGLRARRSKPDPAPGGANADKAGQTTSADSSLTSGLLARKPVENPGPSFKTGLILTAILLVLLAAIAIWSVLFLPNSPMARLFAPQGDEVAATAFDGPAAPDVTSAAPGLGVAPPDETSDTQSAPPAVEMEQVAALPEDAAPAPVPAPEPPLPDIDAELDLEPLPPLPQDLLPSQEETERIYAEDGIWPRTPDRPALGPFDTIDGVYIASIDPDIPGLDAIALPDPATNPGELLRRIPPPPPFGSEFSVDALGLVAATPEGVLTPEGAFIIAGTPPIAAVQRPRDVAPAAADVPRESVEDAILGTFRPTQRPGDLGELRERQLLGGLTITELADRRPSARPESAQEAAAGASLFPGGAQNDADVADTTAVTAGTALAVASSRMPRLRPANIESIVAAAASAPAAEAVPASVAAPQPSIPSNASVTRAATETNAIRLRNVNLIGVTGSPSDRRALVRLSSGRFVRVGVGDRLDGGRVAAIGEASLQYVRRGRNITLDIPG